jgi:hypothetical protein
MGKKWKQRYKKREPEERTGGLKIGASLCGL